MTDTLFMFLLGLLGFNQTELLADEDSPQESSYSIIDGRIFDSTGQELTKDMSYLTQSTCDEREESGIPGEVRQESKGFSVIKEYDDGRYLAGQFLSCLCAADCGVEDVYIFEIESKNSIRHDDLMDAIFQVDQVSAEAIAQCHKINGAQDDSCLWYQIDSIENDTLTLNIFKNDPNNEGTAVYPCAIFSDLESSVDELEAICGYQFEKQINIENVRDLYFVAK